MSEFYFALPRLMAQWFGRNATHSDKNGAEANVVGTLNHMVVYVAAFELLLGGLSLWTQLLLLVPLAILVWLFWLVLFYVNALLIKLLRGAGLMRRLPDNRAQNILVGTITTALAIYLLGAGSWTGVLGFIWIAAVTLNLAAAALLSASPPVRSPHE